MLKREIIKEWIKKNGMRESERQTARDIYADYPHLWNGYMSVRGVLRKINNNGTHEPVKKPTEKQDIITEDQLRSMYDIKTIVISALSSLIDGEYYREADFIRRHLAGKSGYRSILESRIAQPYKGKASGQVFYSHPASIQKMKEEGILV